MLVVKSYTAGYEWYTNTLTQQTFVLVKTYWRRLEDVFSVTFFCFSRRLQDIAARHLHEDVLKISSRRLEEDVFRTSLEGVLKTFWKRLEDVLWIRVEGIWSTSWRCLWKMYWKHVLKTSWRRLGRQKRFMLKTSWKIKDGCSGEAGYHKEFNASRWSAYQRLICFCFVEA